MSGERQVSVADALGGAVNSPPRLRLALDARTLADPHPTGVERVVIELVRALGRLDDAGLELLLFVDRPLAPDPERPGTVVVVPNRIRRLRPLVDGWLVFGLPPRLEALDVDAFLSPNTKLPRWRGPRFATVHGVEWAVRPRDYPWRERLAQRFWFTCATRAAAGLVTFSERTALDLELLAPASNVPRRVVPEGVAAVFGPEPDGGEGSTLARLGIRPPFILSVASDEPRKGLASLVRAFGELRRGRGASHSLVLVGRAGRGTPATRAAIEELGLEHVVHRPGHVPDVDLARLYRSADATVQSSRYEGFGLPLIEAFASSTPVVAVARGAAPELAGDAALLVDSEAPGPLADALARLFDEPELVARLRARGLERARAFTWGAAARGTLDFVRTRLAEGSAVGR